MPDGSVIENPPVDINITWEANPNDPPGDGCNDSGSITYMGADAVPGVSNSYNGPSHKLYSGTRETAVWRLNEDYEPPAWEWT
ncbi:hypothetical protein HY484_03015, partial [Candidatus Woesearchaeota archaeon]|nr:hypothetical protein [Candidatus Woesearchaeota archaeon]